MLKRKHLADQMASPEKQEAKGTSNPFHRLPDDVLNELLYFLQDNDAVKLTTTDKSFYHQWNAQVYANMEPKKTLTTSEIIKRGSPLAHKKPRAVFLHPRVHDQAHAAINEAPQEETVVLPRLR